MAPEEQQNLEEEKLSATQRQNKGGSEQMQTQAAERSNRPSQSTGIASRRQFGDTQFSSSPFAFMRRFGEEMDRLFENFGFSGSWLGSGFGREFFPASLRQSGPSFWSPQIETFERQGQLVLRADLPGLTKDDVEVEITDDAITISGERRNEEEDRGEGYYRSERSYGSFSRRIPLPEGVTADDAEATFQNGVLEITMPGPHPEARGRRLEIKEAAASEPSQGKAVGR